jgi:hypothetical protein
MSKRTQNIAMDWLRGATTPEAKEQVLTTVQSGVPALVLLRNVLKNKLAEVRREQKADFDNPAWPYKQAKLLGKEEALEDIIKLMPRPDNED